MSAPATTTLVVLFSDRLCLLNELLRAAPHTIGSEVSR